MLLHASTMLQKDADIHSFPQIFLVKVGIIPPKKVLFDSFWMGFFSLAERFPLPKKPKIGTHRDFLQ